MATFPARPFGKAKAMRKAILMLLSFGVAFWPAAARTQQQPQTPPSQPQQDQQQAQKSQTQTPSQPQHDSLAEAARKAREQRKSIAKPAKVFDNDTIPKSSGALSVIGEETTKSEAAELKKEEKGEKKDEAYWRARFAKAHAKLKKDQDELDVLQRELGQLQLQYYPDPMKALEQQYTRSDINKQTAKIDAKQKEIQQDQQALSDLDDELRRSGGDPGWARE
jgi:DNA repair exonuclease SbcCD ATPase subunit